MKKLLKLWPLLILLVSLVILLISAVFFYTYIRPKLVIVPDVRGESVSSARALLNQRGLNLTVKSRVYSEEMEKGRIVTQEPRAGKSIAKNKFIMVEISKGKEQVPKKRIVPALEGKKKSEALLAIGKVGLEPKELPPEYSDTWLKDTVMRQNPGPGSLVDPDSEVELVVSMGPEPKSLPPPVLKLVNSNSEQPASGYLRATGEVENVGKTAATAIEVTITFYNENDKIIGTTQAWPSVSVLYPGQKAAWAVDYFLGYNWVKVRWIGKVRGEAYQED